MAITVAWNTSDPTVIHLNFEGRCTWNDLYAAVRQVQAMMHSTQHHIDFICDMSRADIRPIASNPSFAEKLVKDRSESPSLTVMVGADRFTQAMYKVYCRIFPEAAAHYQVDFAGSLEDAYACIARHRAGKGSS